MMGNNFTGTNAGSYSDSDVANLGLYYLAALDLFHATKEPEFADVSVHVSLFEIYGGKLFDLLNDRASVKCLEDSKGNVCFPGLSEHSVSTANELMKRIEDGAVHRSTGTTSRNADSSRSHAVLQLHIYKESHRSSSSRKEFSRLTFIDLAGSERGADTSNASRATRLEGAEINTSLLALKEVIRAMAVGDPLTHIPFRGSKLTQVLKQSFVGKNCRSVMIACISPNVSSLVSRRAVSECLMRSPV
jgi:kinesin family member 2/24